MPCITCTGQHALDHMNLRQVDHYIEGLIATLTEARRRHNTLIPANRLLPEILREIFLYCRAAAPTGDLRWVSVSHVSYCWRTVALDHSTLWNSPDLRYPQFAAEMLRRAQAGPLHIHLSWPPKASETGHARYERGKQAAAREPEDLGSQSGLGCLVSLVMEMSSRIRSVAVLGTVLDVEEVMPLIAASSEWLQRLEIVTPGVQIHERRLFLSQDITTRHYPALETLSADPTSGIPWEGPVLLNCPNLRHLQLTQGHSVLAISTDMREILDTLRRLPLLETITLNTTNMGSYGPLPRWNFGNTIPPLRRRIELAHMKKITLEGHVSATIEYLMQHLELPGDCRTSLMCGISQYHDGALQDDEALRSATRALVHRAFLPAPQSVRLDLSSNGVQVFTFPGPTPKWDSDAWTHHICLRHVPEEGGYARCFEPIVPSLAGLPLQLIIGNYPNFTVPEWEAFLRNNHVARMHVKWCGVNDSGTRHKLNALGTILTTHDDALPHMDTLVLQGIDFEERMPITGYITKSDAVGRIVNALQKRAVAGTLRFVACAGKEQTAFAHWKTLLPVVEWEDSEAL